MCVCAPSLVMCYYTVCVFYYSCFYILHVYYRLKSDYVYILYVGTPLLTISAIKTVIMGTHRHICTSKYVSVCAHYKCFYSRNCE